MRSPITAPTVIRSLIHWITSFLYICVHVLARSPASTASGSTTSMFTLAAASTTSSLVLREHMIQIRCDQVDQKLLQPELLLLCLNQGHEIYGLGGLGCLHRWQDLWNCIDRIHRPLVVLFNVSIPENHIKWGIKVCLILRCVVAIGPAILLCHHPLERFPWACWVVDSDYEDLIPLRALFLDRIWYTAPILDSVVHHGSIHNVCDSLADTLGFWDDLICIFDVSRCFIGLIPDRLDWVIEQPLQIISMRRASMSFSVTLL